MYLLLRLVQLAVVGSVEIKIPYVLHRVCRQYTKRPRRIQSLAAAASLMAVVGLMLWRWQKQWGRGSVRLCADMCRFVGVSGRRQSFRLGQRMLRLRYLLFAVFVKRVHDVVQAFINDLTVASHHRHRFPTVQIHKIHISRALRA